MKSILYQLIFAIVLKLQHQVSCKMKNMPNVKGLNHCKSTDQKFTIWPLIQQHRGAVVNKKVLSHVGFLVILRSKKLFLISISTLHICPAQLKGYPKVNGSKVDNPATNSEAPQPLRCSQPKSVTTCSVSGNF